MYHVLFFHTMWKSLLCMVILSLVWEHMMMGFVEVQNKWGELEMDSFKVLTILSGCKIYKSKTDMILVICLPNLQNIPSYFIQVPWIIHVRCFNLVALQNKCHCRRGNGLFCSQVSSNLLISVLRVYGGCFQQNHTMKRNVMDNMSFEIPVVLEIFSNFDHSVWDVVQWGVTP